MAEQQPAVFGHADRQRIYEELERSGPATESDLRDRLRIDPSGMRHHVAILRRDGFVEERDGELHVLLDESETEEHRSEGVAFEIRRARQRDLTGLVGAIRQVAEDGRYIEAETVADVVDQEDVLLRHDDLEWRIFFVAVVDDDVVGWVHLNAPRMEKLSHTAELTLGVLENYRDHGIGSHLLKRGLEWAASNGYEKIYNSLPATNEEAVDFLEGHDWEVEAVREGHYRIDGEYVDEVMLAKRL
jgi:ribosomal protein S18 acetylase RimI-like enzyme